MKMPMKDFIPDLTQPPYKELINNYSVNPLNESDPFYTDRCFVYRVNDTDMPLNTRRVKIFPNSTATCGLNCDLVGMDKDNNIECNCHNPSKSTSGDLVQEFSSTVMSIYNSSNLGIVSCNVIILC